MRKRPSYNWLNWIYIIQKACCKCNKPFFEWNEYYADLDNKTVYCENCSDPNDLDLVYWEYGRYNEFYDVGNIELFEMYFS